MHRPDIFAFTAHSQRAADYRALTEELEAGKFSISTVSAPAGAPEGEST
jgi:hypothetical protein